MAALGAPQFKWGSHTLHKWRLREKNRSMGLHKVLVLRKTPPTPTERTPREQEIEPHNITESMSLWESLNYLASFKKSFVKNEKWPLIKRKKKAIPLSLLKVD